MALSGVISLKDNATAVLRQVRAEQSAFRKEVEKTKKELRETYNKQYEARINAAPATKVMQSLYKKLEPMHKKLVKVVALKDMATEKLQATTNKVKAFGKMVAAPIIKVKDQVSAGISKISGALKSIAKKVVIPVTVAATIATAGITGAVVSGMELEKQQVSMQHFIDVNNGDKSDAERKQMSSRYLKDLRDNANATPFETGEVIGAGTRALGLTGGDTKAAMELVKVAEDMAALTPGKTVSDAMEALADAKNGEMERLKEFNAKVSKEEYDQLGFDGVVNSKLKTQFDGGASKLASSGSGLLSTITGKLKSNVTDFGLTVLEQLKPAFESIITLIDKTAPVFEQFGGAVADGIGKGITFLTAAIPRAVTALSALSAGFAPMLPQLAAFGTAVGASFQTVATAAAPVLQTVLSTAQSVLPAVLPALQAVVTGLGGMLAQSAPLFGGWVQGIGTVISTLAPIFTKIFGSISDKVGNVAGFISDNMSWIQSAIQTAMPIVSSVLSTAWGVVSPILDIACNVFKILFGVVQQVFPGIQTTITTVWNILKPIVEGIGALLEGMASGLGWLADVFTGNGGSGRPVAGSGAAVSSYAAGGGASKHAVSGAGSAASSYAAGGAPGNANGTNSWRGGVTWVGERGPELMEVPQGARILPSKESLRYSSGEMARSISITLAKLADTIIVREDADIDKIGKAVAAEIKLASANM